MKTYPRLETMPLARLEANPDNPRKITPEALARLKRSMDTFGTLSPLTWNKRTGRLLAGHQRIKIMRADGAKTAQVFVVDIPKAQEQAAMLQLNRHQGDWDTQALGEILKGIEDIELAGFTQADLDALHLSPEPEADADADPQKDRAAELNRKWKVAPGDIWTIGRHRLLCGDSTKKENVERLLAGDKPLMMVTDPPYGVAYNPNWRNNAMRADSTPDGGRAIGKVTNDDRLHWSGAYLLAGADVAYVWHSAVFTAEVARDIQAAGYDIRSQIIWAKLKFAISQGAYHWAHEPCWYAVRKNATADWTGDRKQKTLWADIADNFKPDPRNPLFACQVDKETVYAFNASSTTVWTLPQDKMCDGGHSTQKPVECMARPIRNHGGPLSIVYDPFLGTGTTLVACENTDRLARGCEISPDYCAVILERMQTAFPELEIKRA